MKKKLDSDLKPTLGQVIRVFNVEKQESMRTGVNVFRHVKEGDMYYAIKLADQEGKAKACLLFTESEYETRMSAMYYSEFGKPLTKGRLYNTVRGGKPAYVVRVTNWCGCDWVVFISRSILKAAATRAMSHPKSITGLKQFATTTTHNLLFQLWQQQTKGEQK